MKIRHILGTLGMIILIIHMIAGGLAGSQSQEVSQSLVIENAIPTVSAQANLAPDNVFDQDRAITSKTTIITLIIAVMGIVAFRRNTYS